MRKHSKRLSVALTAGTMAAALVLAGCGSGTPGEPAPGNDGDTTTEAEEPGDGGSSGDAVEIEFWHRTFTPVENDWYKDIVQKFNEAQDEVVVNVTEVPADAWDQKMKAAQAAGKAPDVYTHAGAIEDAVEAEQFHELNGIVSDEALGEIIDAALPVSAIDGTYYAYPLVLEPQTVLFWNKEMLDAAGVDSENAPATWDELLANCAKIAPTLDDGQYCISPAADAPTFAWSTVGQQVNAMGHYALNADWSAPDIDNDGFRTFMDQYKQLWDNGYMAKQATGSYLEAKDFGELKAAYKVSGSWMMSELGSDFPEMLDNTGIGAFPMVADPQNETTTTLGDFKWVVDGKTQKPEAAGKFLEWAIAGDVENLVPFFVATQFTKASVRESVSAAVADSPEAQNAPWSSVISQDLAPSAISGAKYPWDVSLAVGTAIESVMKGSASPDDAIKTAEGEMQKVIETNGLAGKAPSN